MTNIPGPTPGSSDSPEPDDGDSPTVDAHDAGPAQDARPASDAGPSSAGPSSAGPSSDAATPSEEAAAVEAPQNVAAGQAGWAQQQPPPVEGWGRWAPPRTQPPGGQVPHQGQPPSPETGQQPPYGGPRWGPAAGGGWQQPTGAGWGRQVPAAPKPGIIPLRPLGIGEILDGAIANLRRNWRAVIGTTLGVGLVTQTAGAIFQHQFVDTSSLDDLQDNPHPTAGDFMHAIGGSMAASGLSLLVTMVGTIIATSMLTVVVSRAVLGRAVSASEAWSAARPQLPRLLGLTLLTPLLIALVVAVCALPGGLVALAGSDDGGLALATLGVLGGSVVALWLGVLWSLASPALMLEKQGIVAAMKRSMKLVRGSWWRVAGVQIVSVILVVIVSSIIELPFTLVGATVTGDSVTNLFSTDNATSWGYLIFVAIGGVIGAALTLPISAGVTTLLYMDQRIRRESLDLELIRAAQEQQPQAAATQAGAQ
ncbi:glycerophosphoryl diester phosphodiesterase membrane domain-containing protein [Streptomyces sp. V4-01]|uniref:Glycerophosphoryl diester phosphodiesterase membrane domain-containing protein n=1 Tax=Actinacidiphila polyblastidii TaxID=3110430 RepID=A0ABU7P8X3_9ACTN|nr:glycerophosphoryl diester phosphodiesterase membrane domain-containing protein [Streptomyces sp. V4-01]